MAYNIKMGKKISTFRYALWAFLLLAVLMASLAIPRFSPRLPTLSLRINEARGHPLMPVFQEYLQINTSEPIGNTYSAAAFFAAIFERHGIQWEIYESVKGKANLVAVLPGGKGDKPPLILHHHMDTAEIYRPDLWKYDPWGGVIAGPFLYGLGSVDMKSYGICFLDAFLKAHDENWKLDRPVIFYASCAEEANLEAGSKWMLEHHPEYFPPGSVMITEGGMVEMLADTTRFIGIEVGQKSCAGFHVSVSPELKAALDLELPAVVPSTPTLHPIVREFFKTLYPYRISFYRTCLLDPDPCIQGRTYDQVGLPGYLKDLLFDREYWVRLGDGSYKLYISALWGEPIEVYSRRAEKILQAHGVPYSLFVTPPAVLTPSDTPEFKKLAAVYRDLFPGVSVFPYIQGSSITEACLFRHHGVLCYGIVPVRYTIFESLNINLFDERIYLPYFLDGLTLSENLVKALAVKN